MSREPAVSGIVPAYAILLALAFLLFPYSRDFGNYGVLCASQVGIGLWEAAAHYDPIFTLSCYLVGSLVADMPALIVALLFGAAGLYFKFATFLHWRQAFWFILIFYVARFFLVQDVTQIRAGLAAGMLGAVFIALVAGRFAYAAALSTLSVLVHLSTLAALPAILLAAWLDERFLKVAAVAAVAVAVALYVLGSIFPNMDAIATQLLDVLPELDFRLDYYLQNSSPLAEPIYLNFYLTAKLFLLGLFAVATSLHVNRFHPDVYRVVTLSAVALALGVIFKQNGVLSLRLAELFSVFDAVFIGWIVHAMARGAAVGMVMSGFAGFCALLLFRQAQILI